ncbi:hypothetical protein DH2020_018762 [Rehmannia glutinosa]|uniref:CCHC-type domain-containing protein n=1 Tax=Rehmannia glutinosa TaxID=99300 RepID=A0ABR0WNZ3_REHGL
MDPDDIAKLVEELKRTSVGDDDKVFLNKLTVWKEADKMNSCLLAKIFANKPIPRETVKIQMPKILQTSRTVEIEAVGENLYIMDFKSAQDRRRALEEGPWNLFKSLVLFQKIKGLQHPQDVVFKSIDIWVQMHNLPLAFMNRRVLESIGAKMGEVLDLDEGDGGNFWGKYARVRVRIELENPLKKCLTVKVEEEAEDVIILLVYERLPDFCYACGRIGHIIKDCNYKEANKENPSFGPWLKVATHSGIKKNKEESKYHNRMALSESSTSKQ